MSFDELHQRITKVIFHKEELKAIEHFKNNAGSYLMFMLPLANEDLEDIKQQGFQYIFVTQFSFQEDPSYDASGCVVNVQSEQINYFKMLFANRIKRIVKIN